MPALQVSFTFSGPGGAKRNRNLLRRIFKEAPFIYLESRKQVLTLFQIIVAVKCFGMSTAICYAKAKASFWTRSDLQVLQMQPAIRLN